ncbi:polymorphic toxin type 15 domain-containing protein [Burkholderia contaminans]|uniref:polymorphic toxin type 15 domain-containing protein n=3 Tax=Burkholderia contaminans TaxID=488447 RepID=UPI00069A8FC5|nr:polymorphic toxin type 15 domain-containing protein [Burkholderia contaminans]MEB4631481.1 polymorphic toxin type 15 domain-containing protein [Burkholderia contaminans]MEB4637066.1 polymorphic toxin type 15 domain-containing protein [Burkholderia contaminans]MEB4652150.1 polymorphic toxin type 15 domain-containing protein [Burkholderia contaminans]MEB4665685.1 polymorphic toxin type 15 domain-containing protein [Burkholderia contaminans]MEB4668033.1 polymorphic toxin type 15 domain-contain
MSEPLQIEVTGDGADAFREHFKIDSLEQAKSALEHADALWNDPGPPGSQKRDVYDWASKEVVRRYETGRYKPGTLPKKTADESRSGSSQHIANESDWKAFCTQPDFCRVGNQVVGFETFAVIDHKQVASPNVKAQGKPVYRVGDTHQGVQADAGQGVVSQTSGGSGYVKILSGQSNVKVNGLPVARNGSACLINCNAEGVGGTTGQIETAYKSTQSSADDVLNPDAPPGQRTSKRLDDLQRQRAALNDKLINVDDADKVVDFDSANKTLDGWIGEIKGTPGSYADQAAQAGRGLLGFGKDAVMGIGNLAYSGAKGAVGLAQTVGTSAGREAAVLDAQILAENIRIGNITPGTVGNTALNIGKAIVKPVTDPWSKGQYTESVTRGLAEVITAPLASTKLAKLAKLGEVGDAEKAIKAEQAIKAEKAAEAERAGQVTKAPEVETPRVPENEPGVHVKPKERLPEKKVPCFHPYDKEGFKKLSPAEQRQYLREYAKQLRGQQDAINSLTANEFQAARDAYKAAGRNPLADAMQEATRSDFVEHVRGSIYDSLRSSGMGAKEAMSAATERAKTIASKLAALHEPDMVAGGWAHPDPTRMGSSSVNSSIGGSWNQGDRLSTMEGGARDAISSGKGDALMNVKLEPCRGKGMR